MKIHTKISPGGGWVYLLQVRPLNAGAGNRGLFLGLGADKDIPLRPWPQLWVERRPNGMALSCVVWCGLLVGVQG